MRTRNWLYLGVASFLLASADLPVLGQLYTGSITGVVRDPSGSVVPNAKVTITDNSKGYTYSATTDSSGIYTARNLPPSTYTARVEAAGFAPFERPGVALDVNGNVTVNADLQVATTGQTVTVAEAVAPLLQTQDAVTGQTLNRTTINDLPLINRQVFDWPSWLRGCRKRRGRPTAMVRFLPRISFPMAAATPRPTFCWMASAPPVKNRTLASQSRSTCLLWMLCRNTGCSNPISAPKSARAAEQLSTL